MHRLVDTTAANGHLLTVNRAGPRASAEALCAGNSLRRVIPIFGYGHDTESASKSNHESTGTPMKIVFTADRSATALEVAILESEMNARLRNQCSGSVFGTDMRPPKALAFELEGGVGVPLILRVEGHWGDIDRAIRRWCSCCSTVESFGLSRVFTATRPTASEHLAGQTPVTLRLPRQDAPISFTVGAFSAAVR